MKNQQLIRDQLDDKIKKFHQLANINPPSGGWIHAIRNAVNMSLKQLGNRLSITPQGVREMEERESNGNITLNLLKQVARALDMKFVYGFVPNDGTLEKMVEKRAEKLSKSIVMRTSLQMKLENQKNSEKRLEKAIKEMTEELKTELPKILWD